MSMRSKAGSAYRFALNRFFRQDIALGNLGPVVSFTFDDFPRSALTAGGPILERFGARATFYISMGLMGHTDELGEYFNASDLKDALERGHDIGSHGFSHMSAKELGAGRLARDLERCRSAIGDTLGGVVPLDFSYPFGTVTLAAKARIGGMMRSCRGVYAGLNGPVVDLNLLRANALYGDDRSFAEVKALILENERKKSWLIFYSHDVAAKPSPYGCTPELLERVVLFARERNAKIMPVGEVLNRICAANERD